MMDLKETPYYKKMEKINRKIRVAEAAYLSAPSPELKAKLLEAIAEWNKEVRHGEATT